MASEKSINLKKEEVSKLAAKMKEAKLILLADYRGINVAEVTSLRNDLRNVNAEYTVIKNNITRRALAEAGIEMDASVLEGPTAVIMTNEDYLEPTKAIYNFSKENEFYKIKGGVVEGKVISAEEMLAVSKLPSREGLYSMLLSCLQAPIRNFACAVKAVAEKE